MQNPNLAGFHESVLEANRTLSKLLVHLIEWQKDKAPSAEKIMIWVEKQEILLREAEQKTNQLKNCLLSDFSKDQHLESALSNLEIILSAPEHKNLKAAWQDYQKHLSDCLIYNQQNGAQVSRTLPFVHHLLHLFLGHEQEVVVYNAKGKKSSGEIHRAS